MRHRLQQFAPLVIHAYEEAEFHLPLHGHTYYEVVYIRAGHGQHWLNGHQVPYGPGHLFLLSPQDEHRFAIAASTRFVFIKFTADYVQPPGLAPADPAAPSLLPLLHAHWLKEHALPLLAPQAAIVARLVDTLAELADDAPALRQPSTRHQVLALLHLVREVLARQHLPAAPPAPEASPDALLAYVHQHIYHPAALRIAAVAQQFHLAPSYFGAYFRRTVGLGYRQYVHRYRLQLLESRARQGATLKQLAAEFHFTDETHLSRYFRQQAGQPFSSYRTVVATVR